jgi:hypothetical protein
VTLRPWLTAAALLLFFIQLLGPVALDFVRRNVRRRRVVRPLQEHAA